MYSVLDTICLVLCDSSHGKVTEQKLRQINSLEGIRCRPLCVKTMKFNISKFNSGWRWLCGVRVIAVSLEDLGSISSIHTMWLTTTWNASLWWAALLCPLPSALTHIYINNNNTIFIKGRNGGKQDRSVGKNTYYICMGELIPIFGSHTHIKS